MPRRPGRSWRTMTEREGAAAAVGVALLAVALTIGMMHGRTHSDLLFYVCALAQSGLSVAAGRLAAGAERRSALVILVGAAILLRLYFVAEAPTLSGDVYRYIWDGRVVNAGFNPYAHVPADPALAALRDPAQYGLIDKRDYAVTLYPPVAEGLFALVTRASTSVWAMKLAMVVAECVAVLAVVRLLARARPADRSCRRLSAASGAAVGDRGQRTCRCGRDGVSLRRLRLGRRRPAALSLGVDHDARRPRQTGGCARPPGPVASLSDRPAALRDQRHPVLLSAVPRRVGSCRRFRISAGLCSRAGPG